MTSISEKPRLSSYSSLEARLASTVHPVLAAPAIHFVACLGLCAAYIQGPISKLTDFPSAIAEMRHFGLSPAAPFAVVVIVFELGASILLLTGFFRWLAALSLAGFTLIATFVALRFWEMPQGQERLMAANAFFEHLGLIGGFLLVAWFDLNFRFVSKAKV